KATPFDYLKQNIDAKISENDIDSEDHFTIDGKIPYVLTGGREAILQGISFDGKRTYIKQGDIGRLDPDNDGLDDFEAKAAKDLTLYLSPVEGPQGNYIQLVKETLTFSDVEIQKKMARLGFSSGQEMVAGMIINSEDGEITLTPKPGNLLFNMVKRQYNNELGKEELLPDLVADDRDALEITVYPGGKADIRSRLVEGKVPSLSQSGSGEVKVETGRGMVIKATPEKLTVAPPELFTPDDESAGAMIDSRNSVPMLIKTSAGKASDEALISSSNKYLIWNSQMQKTVFMLYQDKDAVTSDLSFNMMKTIADLQHKYPMMPFKIESGCRERGICTASEYTEITPNLAQVTDKFMARGGIEKFLKEIRFGTFGNAGASPTDDFAVFYPTMIVGERALDAARLMANPIRGATPSAIFGHEFSHTLDDTVTANELDLSKDAV
ncbi:MAG: hypothetical protein AABX05_04710, partial [Nanoarchaeota archaeon]